MKKRTRTIVNAEKFIEISAQEIVEIMKKNKRYRIVHDEIYTNSGIEIKNRHIILKF